MTQDLLERHHSLLVAERFGPTLQGEGPSAGQSALFVRLARCNLACGSAPDAAFACDTPYTWDQRRYDLSAESRRETLSEVVEWATGDAPGLVVITGGEPLLQQPALLALAQQLSAAGKRIEIETNATIAPVPELLAVAWLNASPKLANSGMAARRRVVGPVLQRLAGSGRVIFKFVACDRADLAEIDALVRQYALAPVWVMPEGTTSEVVLGRARDLAEQVLARGWNLSLRTHIVLWGDVRGR
ncbi:7-carboxy-7-deazaguanine synthase QueE [Nonomuraea sp. NPDC049504]|uniref:7-carboxy-7-deazaguanine synthase QueE n=1 Tax=Nonomuraea sp. NPDC049504 TaxID=3154729 RepID=UPI00344541F0